VKLIIVVAFVSGDQRRNCRQTLDGVYHFPTAFLFFWHTGLLEDKEFTCTLFVTQRLRERGIVDVINYRPIPPTQLVDRSYSAYQGSRSRPFVNPTNAVGGSVHTQPTKSGKPAPFS